MRLDHTRSVEPLSLTSALALDSDDLALAFTAEMDSEEQELFSDVFSPDWLAAPISERLATLSMLVKRIEDALAASNLNLSAGTPAPK